jgi:O-antigen/teichoic acid export membrane protein
VSGTPVTAGAVAASTLGSLVMYALLKARGLIVVPLYALLLDPASLGIVTMAMALATLVAPVLHLGIPTGLLIELPHLPARQDLARAMRAAFSLVAVAALVTLAGLPWLLPVLPWRSLDAVAPQALVVAVLACGMALREVAQVLPQLFRETRFLTWLGVGIEYGGSAVGLLLVALDGGPGGLLWGTALGLVAGATVATRRTLALTGPQTGWDGAILRSGVRLGLPLLAITTAQTIVQSADRFFLAHFVGADAVGVYGLAYTVASAVFAVTATLNLVFLPVGVGLLQAPERLRRLVEEALRLIVVVLGFGVAGAFLLARPVIRLLAGIRFDGAAQVLPYLVLACSVYTVLQLLQWVPMTVTRRVIGIVAVNAGVAATNILLDVLLIPRWAGIGAALAAVGALALGALCMGIVARRALPGWSVLPALGAALVALLAALAGSRWALPAEASLGAMAAAAVLLAVAYAGAAFLTRVLGRSDLEMVRTALSRGGTSRH